MTDPVAGAHLKQVRVRATAAQVNAGIDLVPAKLGFRYRLVDVIMIGVGGAPASATTVDVTGVLSGSSRKLFSSSIGGSFTQSKAMCPDSTGTTVLADGASFTSNDVNTPIGLSKTGSNLTGATAIDVILSFAVEP